MKKIIVDRIEENIAVCEDNGNTVSLPLSSLPENTKEGHILVLTENGWQLCKEDTDERRKKLFDLQNSLFDE